MKTIFLFIFFLAAAGVYSASAQQKTRDILFPDYASDQAKLKSASSGVKPIEATLTTREAILSRIFTNYQKPTNNTSLRPAPKAPAATLPSLKTAADSEKEVQAQREALKGKTITPKPDQGPENSPKPKN